MFRIFGVDPAAFRGTKEDFFERVHPDDLPALVAARAHAVATGETLSIDHRIVRPDGVVRWVHERADMQRDAAGRPVSFIGVVQDITDRKQAEEALKTAEEQLRQSQKMEAIGRLAGGVAHDFNNLLSIITGRSELLLRHRELAAAMRRDVELIHRTADRAASLTRQLLAFSRKQVLQPKVLDLNAVVANMGRMLRRVIGEDIDLVIVARPGVARVNADPGQLEQVLLNLAVNARDAMPGGGRLTIETADIDLDEEHARLHPGVGARAPRDARGDRHRRRHGAGRARPDLRAVLHHEGGGEGDGPRPLDGVRHRAAERRHHLGVQRARAGHDLQDLPAERQRRPRRMPTRRPSRRAVATRPCCSARTRRTCASSRATCWRSTATA